MTFFFIFPLSFAGDQTLLVALYRLTELPYESCEQNQVLLRAQAKCGRRKLFS